MRGFKTVIRQLPHEVVDVEPVLSAISAQDPKDFQVHFFFNRRTHYKNKCDCKVLKIEILSSVWIINIHMKTCNFLCYLTRPGRHDTCCCFGCLLCA